MATTLIISLAFFTTPSLLINHRFYRVKIKEESRVLERMSKLRVIGIIEIVVRDGRGRIKYRIIRRNLITDAGLEYIAKALGGLITVEAFKYIAIGSGTTAPSGSDTALENEIAREEGSVSLETTNVTNDTLKVSASFIFTASYDISESGLFNAATGGTMLARQTFDTISVKAGYELDVTWRIIFSR